MPIDLFAHTAAILIPIVSNSYYGMLRGQIHINLPPKHPIMSFETIKIKMAVVSAKRSMDRYGLCKLGFSYRSVSHIIKRFHSRDQQPYWITETKESICIKIEFNSRRISLVHHHGRHSFVLEHQYGRRHVM